MSALPKSWITTSTPSPKSHLTPTIREILVRVADESKDKAERIYTQSEVIRAVELALATDAVRTPTDSHDEGVA